MKRTMIRRNRRYLSCFTMALAIIIISCSLSTSLAFTFTPTTISRVVQQQQQQQHYTSMKETLSIINRRRRQLFYQTLPTTSDTINATAPQSAIVRRIPLGGEDITLHINDSNYESILLVQQQQEENSLPVLIDCYTNNCGPCKLIERELSIALPKYTTNSNPPRLTFCKWDTNTKEQSTQFMNIVRKYNMTFSKLPTLLLFMNGKPVASRGGMASATQIDMFLQKHLPSLEKGEERRPRQRPDGALGISTCKMNR